MLICLAERAVPVSSGLLNAEPPTRRTHPADTPGAPWPLSLGVTKLIPINHQEGPRGTCKPPPRNYVTHPGVRSLRALDLAGVMTSPLPDKLPREGQCPGCQEPGTLALSWRDPTHSPHLTQTRALHLIQNS